MEAIFLAIVKLNDIRIPTFLCNYPILEEPGGYRIDMVRTLRIIF